MDDIERLRHTMKAIYFSKKIIDALFHINKLETPAICKQALFATTRLQICEELNRTPATVFRYDKPEIDKRRARKYLRRKKGEKILAVTQGPQRPITIKDLTELEGVIND